MDFIFKPSLQHIAVVKIVTTLLIQDDIRYIIESAMFCRTEGGMWNEAENKLIEKVQKLALPNFLKDRIVGAIKPMYNELILWRNYHLPFTPWSDLCSFDGTLHYIRWTSQGTVDKQKTAELWIEGGVLCIFDQYVLACMYCLTYKIQILSTLPCDAYDSDEHGRAVYTKMSELVIDWTFYSRTSDLYECTRCQNAFIKAVAESNQLAAQYFWGKLVPEENEELLVKVVQYLAASEKLYSCIIKEYYGEIMCFLLSKMCLEQQIEVIRLRPYDVLRSLLDWPRQSFFLETAKRTWEFLPVHDYSKLLFTDILQKVNRNYKDYNYLELFKDVWIQSPLTHKKHIFDEFSCMRPLFGFLFGIKDEQCIRPVLKDATIEKMNLICSTQGLKCCESLINAEKWELLRYFIRKCVSSEDGLETLKQKLQVLFHYHNLDYFMRKIKLNCTLF